MLTSSQKKIFEWPFLIFVVWILQVLEMSSWRFLPSYFTLHFCPIFVAYLALTRDQTKMILLTLLISSLFSVTTSLSGALYVSTFVWAVLIAKFAVSTFTLEGHRPFIWLSMGMNALWTLLLWLSSGYFGSHPSVGFQIKNILFSTLSAGVVAWFMYPFLVSWDAYYEHEADEARRLDQSIRVR